MKNLVVLVSGGGTNLQRIIDCTESGAIEAKVSLVVADRECFGLERAKNHHIPEVLISRGKDFCQKLEQVIPENTDLIILAGFLSIINQDFIKKFKNKIINIHPSLLPQYGGKGMWGENVHRAVIEAGEKESGVTVHYVTEEIDGGEIILQQKISLEENETIESLSEKIHKVEYELFPKAINKVLES